MGFKLNVYLQSDNQKDAIDALAESFGYVWGEKPNASKLIQALADGDLIAARVPPKGHIAPTVEGLIMRMQPFELAYARADGNVERHKILYAEVVRRWQGEVSSPGGHWYLECYCPEPVPNPHISELAHNRTFRLDKLRDAVALPVEAEWRSEGLEYVDVEIDLLGGLAHNYEPLEGRDLQGKDRWINGGTRRVVWRVTSYFWTRRYLLRYGAGCRVVEPRSFREAFRLEILDMLAMY